MEVNDPHRSEKKRNCFVCFPTFFVSVLPSELVVVVVGEGMDGGGGGQQPVQDTVSTAATCLGNECFPAVEGPLLAMKAHTASEAALQAGEPLRCCTLRPRRQNRQFLMR